MTIKGARIVLLLVGFAAFLCGFEAEAQDWTLRKFTQVDGLPGNRVNKVIQDRKGVLWIATTSGAATYDGRIFNRIPESDVLFGSPVKTVFEDSRGDIWFGTVRKGLVRKSGKSFTNYTTADGLLSDNINVLNEDAQGRIWVGTPEGISVLDSKGKSASITTAAGLSGNDIQDILRDKQGRMWVASLGGLDLIVRDKIQAIQCVTANGARIVYSLTQGFDGRVWAGTYNGVEVFDAASLMGREYYTESALRVHAVHPDRFGQVWVGTYGSGILILSEGKSPRRFNPSKDDPNANIVESLIEDREGNYWIGTFGGLFKYNAGRFSHFTTEQGLSGNNILSVYCDTAARIWVGSVTGGLSRYSDGKFNHVGTQPELVNATVWAIVGHTAERFWLGTAAGPWLFDAKLEKATRISSFKPLSNQLALLERSVVYTVCQLSDGRVAFGTDRGVYVLMKDSIFLINASKGLVSEKVRVLTEDSNGALWIGTMKGVFRSKDGQLLGYSAKHALPLVPVTGMEFDEKGNLLCSMYEHGVMKLDPMNLEKKPALFGSDEGLFSRKVLFCLSDKQGRTWLGTDMGVELIERMAPKKDGKLKSVLYDKSKGYPGLETNVAAEDSSGSIWFGTVNGVVRYDPKAGDLSATLPLVSIDKIQLFLQNVDWNKKKITVNPLSGLPENLVLSHFDNYVTFVCNAVYLTAPGEVRYRYMLEGFDEQWSPSSDFGQVSYSNVPPGDYMFKVQASANGLEWSVPLTFAFTIKAPLWKTPLFIFLYFAAAIGIIYLIYKIKTRSLLLTQEDLRRTVDERTRELSDKNIELAKLSLVASETANAVMIFDAKREIEWVNTGFTRLTGYTIDELRRSKGTNISQLTSNPDVLSGLELCIREKQSIVYESEIHHKDGSSRWASSTLTPIVDEHSKLKNIVVIDTDITLHKQMEDQIRAALEEKGLLLREIHHRVKNNLQIIISLFNLQTSYVTDQNAYKALREGQDRIKSMALIHERFYQADGLSQIDFDDYIKRLAENLFQSFRIPVGKITLNIHSEKIALDIDTAVPTGLIINEIVTNALKHAFTGRPTGCISIELLQTETDHFRLIIADDGIGFPAGVDPETTDSLGIQLIQALSNQLDGVLKIESVPGKGVKYIITFKRIS
jgi:PAS domain S-box-containing protein